MGNIMSTLSHLKDVCTACVRSVPITVAATLGAAAFGGHILRRILDTPSRKYTSKAVGDAYDSWTEDNILEHYWGEHVHLGYYSSEERVRGSFKKSFKKAKDDFVEKLMSFGCLDVKKPPKMTLDVGCGIGGSSRILGRKFGDASQIIGISLSPHQIQRAKVLAESQKLEKICKFEVMDAMEMTFADNSFDLVWVCESTEHMPNKERVIQQISRVLKPGGRVIVAVWSQRDDSEIPFNDNEKSRLQYLYDHWSHPPFISVKKFKELMENTGSFSTIVTGDWTEETLPSWYHQILLGIIDPIPWISKPKLYWKTIQDAWCVHRMHQAFKSSLMQYAVLTATKQN